MTVTVTATWFKRKRGRGRAKSKRRKDRQPTGMHVNLCQAQLSSSNAWNKLVLVYRTKEHLGLCQSLLGNSGEAGRNGKTGNIRKHNFDKMSELVQYQYLSNQNLSGFLTKQTATNRRIKFTEVDPAGLTNHRTLYHGQMLGCEVNKHLGLRTWNLAGAWRPHLYYSKKTNYNVGCLCVLIRDGN
jgi:hypothetical protein